MTVYTPERPDQPTAEFFAVLSSPIRLAILQVLVYASAASPTSLRRSRSRNHGSPITSPVCVPVDSSRCAARAPLCTTA